MYMLCLLPWRSISINAIVAFLNNAYTLWCHALNNVDDGGGGVRYF